MQGIRTRKGRSVNKTVRWTVFCSEGRRSYASSPAFLQSKSALIPCGVPKSNPPSFDGGFLFLSKGFEPEMVVNSCLALPSRLSLIYGRRNRGIVHRLNFLYGFNTALYNARFGNITLYFNRRYRRFAQICICVEKLCCKIQFYDC